MITLDIEQGTPEWFAARCGIPSASCFDKIITTKGEPSKQREKYLWQLAAERVSGITEKSYANSEMQRGIELESEARSLYELANEVNVQRVGLCFRLDKSYCCSPDGLVGDYGLIEIKCPIASTHVGYLIQNDMPPDYFQQTQGQLLVTEREWVDFISYYPGLKPLIVRVNRDEQFIEALWAELLKFNKELEAITERIR